MQIINTTKLIMVDIDDTLIVWVGDEYKPHEKHIESIKKFFKRGHSLIAWSAGGAVWAGRVVKELGLEDYFLYAMDKPSWFIDDKPASEFMPEANRIYFPLTQSEAYITFESSPMCDPKLTTVLKGELI